mmetsp:Transcript_29238/g.33496  ORF Transcript_29238/g.33496 Transcript_29238/m.33496 type:complete len:106 (-) Transcript_29238:2811-3128(-)
MKTMFRNKGIKETIVAKHKYHKKLCIEKVKRKSFMGQSSDNSATLNNVSPRATQKKNDAATNTQHDYSFTQDMLSFQVVNNSPTFEGARNSKLIEGSTPISGSVY